MNDINATIGISNLPFIQQNLERSRELARLYKNKFLAQNYEYSTKL